MQSCVIRYLAPERDMSSLEGFLVPKDIARVRLCLNGARDGDAFIFVIDQNNEPIGMGWNEDGSLTARS
jgi:hypothetical protein